jgi:hypothetical protein
MDLVNMESPDSQTIDRTVSIEKIVPHPGELHRIYFKMRAQV